MDSDRIEGRGKKAEGELQESWGEVKDKARDVFDRDDESEGAIDADRVEGKAKQQEGEVQETWGQVKDKARDLKDEVADRLDRNDDR